MYPQQNYRKTKKKEGNLREGLTRILNVISQTRIPTRTMASPMQLLIFDIFSEEKKHY